MLLSDQLFQIGSKSNLKNNLSMNEAKEEMLRVCREIVKNDATRLVNVKNSFTFAANELNKKGYKFFKPDHFHV